MTVAKLLGDLRLKETENQESVVSLQNALEQRTHQEQEGIWEKLVDSIAHQLE